MKTFEEAIDHYNDVPRQHRAWVIHDDYFHALLQKIADLEAMVDLLVETHGLRL